MGVSKKNNKTKQKKHFQLAKCKMIYNKQKRKKRERKKEEKKKS